MHVWVKLTYSWDFDLDPLADFGHELNLAMCVIFLGLQGTGYLLGVIAEVRGDYTE